MGDKLDLNVSLDLTYRYMGIRFERLMFLVFLTRTKVGHPALLGRIRDRTKPLDILMIFLPFK